MNEDCAIRPAAAGDIGPLVRLIGILFSVEPDFRADPAAQEAGLRLLLADPGRAVVLVAEEGGAGIVGMVTGQLLASTAQGSWSVLLEDMVVDPGRRGRGIGRSLVRALELWGLERGATRVQLLADRENAPALGFYAKIGYLPTRMGALRKCL